LRNLEVLKVKLEEKASQVNVDRRERLERKDPRVIVVKRDAKVKLVARDQKDLVDTALLEEEVNGDHVDLVDAKEHVENATISATGSIHSVQRSSMGLEQDLRPVLELNMLDQ
jgi:hypothetical protein